MVNSQIVSCEIQEKLFEYSKLLKKWNQQINLISFESGKDIEQRHILDSFQLLNFIDEKDTSILDLGSGAGLPGIVLSICGIKKVILVESDVRKAAFLLQASKISSNPVEIKNNRMEELRNLSCNILVSRAFADLNAIFNYCRDITVSEKFLLHKGKTYESEIVEARKHWLFNVKIHDSITSKEGKILEITNVKPRIL